MDGRRLPLPAGAFVIDDAQRPQLQRELGKLSADIAFVNGNVITINAKQPGAQAVCAKNGRILAAGTDSVVLQRCGPETRVFDLAGKTLLPGFVESHNHVSANARIVLQVDCTAASNASIDDILDKVAERAATQPKGTWIEGYGFDNTLLAEKRFPDRRDLDKAAPEHPVHLWHVSGHFTSVNSLALDLAGITQDTPDPDGGEIRRDEHGVPTGVLAEPPAGLMVLRLIPPKTPEEVAQGLKIVSDQYVKAGVTSTHDANLGVWGGLSELQAFEHAFANGKFAPRVYAFIWTVLEDFIDNDVALGEVGIGTGCGDEWLKIGAVKIFADGSIPGLTAAMSEPYFCDSNKKGYLIFEPEELNKLVLRYHEAGFQLAIHANGDHCIGVVIDAFEQALRACPRPDHRHRIEHCSMATEEHLERMAHLGIITTFYTAQIHGWGDRHREMFLGPDRAERIFPTRSAEEKGIVFGLHGDCPVTPISPLHCLYTAVARETKSGHILGQDQRISVDRALRALTIDGAYLAFEENIKGSIEPGKLADFVVLSEDPHDLEPAELQRLEVEMTVIDGKVVYEKGKHP